MEIRHHILAFLLCACAAVSCIYDFDPQIDGEGGYMIVSGDLVIGTICSVNLNYSWSLVDTTATEEERMKVLYGSRMHVEDSRGGRYENLGSYLDGVYSPIYTSSAARFDLREADPSLQYRLVIENEKGTYVSTWETALSPGTIDKLSYHINDAGTQMQILVSAHGDGTSGCYYRWTVGETWEFHADVFSYYKFERTGSWPDYEYALVPYLNGENTYYCWTSGQRTEIMTASTADLKEDRLIDHQLYTLGRSEERVSILYCAEVQQTRISEESYRYWETLNRNGYDVGGLFSPEPSELRGNVVNVDDPTETVLGYVDVQSVISDRLFVDNNETRFYRSARAPLPAPDTLSTMDEWINAMSLGMSPGNEILDEETGRIIGYEWWPTRCVDCRMMGGSKNKPQWWPNQHI